MKAEKQLRFLSFNFIGEVKSILRLGVADRKLEKLVGLTNYLDIFIEVSSSNKDFGITAPIFVLLACVTCYGVLVPIIILLETEQFLVLKRVILLVNLLTGYLKFSKKFVFDTNLVELASVFG